MGKQKTMKSFEELEFRDDFMFGKVMEDKELCREVLECLLQRPVGELIEVQTQKSLKYTSDGKPIRLDVYNEDSDKTVYDAEMQNQNNKTIESLELPKRSRFYQGAIDIDFMNRGNLYKNLPDSNMMFICTFDPFGCGISRYTFTSTCEEEPKLQLRDGTTKIFYNSTYRGNDLPDDLKELYDYVQTGIAESDLTKKIDAAVVKGRKNEIWRTQYMKEWVVLQEAKEEGREEGREEEREQIIGSMLKKGKTIEEISDLCNYPIEEVKAIDARLTTTV